MQRGAVVKPLDVRFAERLEAAGWLAEGAGVVVGVSGGVDSMTLLHLMRFRDARPRIRLHAAHVDHRMREESGDDAAWLEEICGGWGVRFHLKRAARPVATEAEGRRLRYRFLDDVRRSIGDGAVTMTAHTADDQAETVLFRAARGSGPRGLRGIRPARAPGIVRPLLPFRRAEIEAFAAEREIPFREDPSNRDVRWTRNRIRHGILPALEKAVPGAGAALAALAGTSRLEAAALDELVDERIEALAGTGHADPAAAPRTRVPAGSGSAGAPAGFALDRDGLRSLSPAVLTMVLRRAVRRLGGDPGRGATAAMVRLVQESASGRRVDAGCGVIVENDLDIVKIRSGTEAGRAGPGGDEAAVRVDPGRGAGTLVGRGWVAEVAWGPGRLRGYPHVAHFAEGDVAFPLTVRPWVPGDRMRMPYGLKKVKKLLLEARVPAEERDACLVVADASGAIVWVPGIGDPVPGTAGGAGARGCWMAIGPALRGRVPGGGGR